MGIPEALDSETACRRSQRKLKITAKQSKGSVCRRQKRKALCHGEVPQLRVGI